MTKVYHIDCLNQVHQIDEIDESDPIYKIDKINQIDKITNRPSKLNRQIYPNTQNTR